MVGLGPYYPGGNVAAKPLFRVAVIGQGFMGKAHSLGLARPP